MLTSQDHPSLGTLSNPRHRTLASQCKNQPHPLKSDLSKATNYHLLRDRGPPFPSGDELNFTGTISHPRSPHPFFFLGVASQSHVLLFFIRYPVRSPGCAALSSQPSYQPRLISSSVRLNGWVIYESWARLGRTEAKRAGAYHKISQWRLGFGSVTSAAQPEYQSGASSLAGFRRGRNLPPGAVETAFVVELSLHLWS